MKEFSNPVNNYTDTYPYVNIGWNPVNNYTDVYPYVNIDWNPVNNDEEDMLISDLSKSEIINKVKSTKKYSHEKR